MSSALLRTLRAGTSDFLRQAAGLPAAFAVLSLFAATAQAAQLTLAWDPSPSSSVTGYYVYVGTAPGTTDRRIDVTGLTAAITGLNQGKTYYFSVSAHDSAGTESPRSNEVARAMPYGDFNFDGKSDILWRHATSGLNEIWTMSGATRVATVSLPTVAADSEIAATADFNGDGTTDILWRGTDGANTMWLITNGTRTAATLTAVTDGNSVVVGAGDFNGDGKADILWRNPTTGTNTISMMDGATILAWLPTSGFAPSSNWTVAAISDLNGDGKSDIFWRNTATGGNHIWLMDGATRTSYASITTIHTDWKVVGTSDLNGDGKADVLWRNVIAGGSLLAWFMDGTTRTNSVPVGGALPTWSVVAVADFNGDGKDDILWRNSSTGGNAMFLMEGATRTSALPVSHRSDLGWVVIQD